MLFFSTLLQAQSYTSYFTGNTVDTITQAQGGICLMGGASEEDHAMIWFLQRAQGGDILVLRASGNDGYNNYMYTSLGVDVNSVETIVFNQASAAHEPYIHQKIQQAEAIWFAGGDQWDYVSYWRNSPIDSLINSGIQNRKLVIGGTSAGMAILGGYYFSAENGTVSSATALNNPYDYHVTIDSSSFLQAPYLSDVITDTHYDSPDRKGRHMVFLARILADFGKTGKGIACDEYTAVCIDTNGIARVFGDYPSYDDNAYFIAPNCEIVNPIPENCTQNSPLQWNLGGEAVKVYSIQGTPNANNSFDLKDWMTGTGGNWKNWYVVNGVLSEQAGTQPNCTPNSISHVFQKFDIKPYPNPADKQFLLETNPEQMQVKSIHVYNAFGHIIWSTFDVGHINEVISSQNWNPGLYYISICTKNNQLINRKIIIQH
jgi:cyanophycinase-like exopeptidase